MAVSISGTTIKMTKGDTLKTYLTLKQLKEGAEQDSANPDDFEDYTPFEGDRIRFAMKESYDDSIEPLIIKDIPTETLLLHLVPEDTKSLVAPKTYVYDVEITYANGDVDTFIPKAKLVLTEEVH